VVILREDDLDASRRQLIYALAVHEHGRWSGQARTALDDMTQERRDRWDTLSKTSYDQLSNDMKIKDLDQVKSILKIIYDMGFDIIKKDI
jgi:hypothetical protein